MSTPTPFLIRDGLDADLPALLALDHRYETDTVWQMTLRQEDGWLIGFRTERLPRQIEITYPASVEQFQPFLPDDHCFLVATRRDDSTPLGYLTMRHDAVHQIGFIGDLVVTRPHRRTGIGSRLINVAGLWAKERGVTRLILETQTKNYPAILFIQAIGFTFCGYNDQYFRNRDIAVYFSQSLR